MYFSKKKEKYIPRDASIIVSYTDQQRQYQSKLSNDLLFTIFPIKLRGGSSNSCYTPSNKIVLFSSFHAVLSNCTRGPGHKVRVLINFGDRRQVCSQVWQLHTEAREYTRDERHFRKLRTLFKQALSSSPHFPSDPLSTMHYSLLNNCLLRIG